MELSVSSVSVVMLLSVFVHDVAPHRSERTVPRIVPSKLQLFEYANLTVNCEGFFNNMTQWRVLRKVSGRTTPCNKNSKLFGPCHMTMVYTDDSGEYWCESKDQQTRSESVNIAVTAGDVVLESPVRPVMVGDDVTLHCVERKNKKPSTEFIFYKDGAELNTSSTGEMTIHNISESDQGLYRCSTSDTEFSRENLLRVRAVLLQCPHRPVTEGTKVTLICTDKMAAPNHTALFFKDGETIGNSSSGKLTLHVSKSDEGVYKCRSSERRESEEQWLTVRDTSDGDVSTVSPLVGLVALPLLLLVFWFIYKRHKGQRSSSGSETCAAVTKPKRTNRATAVSETIYSEISEVEEPRTGNDPESSRAETTVYSTVNKPKNRSRGADATAELYSTVDKKKKKRRNGDDPTEVAELYSVVKKNKSKKSVESSRGTEADDCLYSRVR